MRVGQSLEIINSDPTLHNIHALPKNNSEFNTGQPIQGMKTNHTFTAKEVMVPFNRPDNEPQKFTFAPNRHSRPRMMAATL